MSGLAGACAGAGRPLNAVWEALLTASEAGERVALATVVGVEGSAPRHGGARMVVWPDGRIVGTIGGGTLEHRVIAEAQEALLAGRPRRYAVNLTRDLGMCCGGAMEVYIEPQEPRPHLILFGAGHVALAAGRQADALSFRVTVVDDREDWNSPERFPFAERLLVDARAYARTLDGAPTRWVFVTTHEHALDQDLIEILLPRAWAWIGLIGSKVKVTRFFLRLRAAGMDPARFASLRSPVGLDIGAETPEEIAVSVAAQWVQVRRQKGGLVPPLVIPTVP